MFVVILVLVVVLESLSVSVGAATLTGTVSVPEGLPSASNIVVYIETVTGKTFAPVQRPLVMDQRNYVYSPHVLPVVVGSTVEFPNSDPDAHNTYSVADCCPFNLGTYPRGEKRTVRFDKVGVAEILCNIHPQMGAYVLVLQNPFFAVTDSAGRFTIRNVPSGEHTLVVWHEVLPNLRQRITIANRDIQFNFALKGWPKTESSASSSEEMVLIPAGEFVMGADDRQSNEKPRRKISLAAFRIDRTEVTNAQFCDFLNAIRRNREEEGATWIDLDDPGCKIRPGKKRGEFVVEAGFESFPVVCVSCHGAASYANWLGKRLPSEAEWEKAARGTDGREWPWGSESASGRANLGSSSPLSPAAPRVVGSFPKGASVYGCLDMAGNVWEWTTTNLDDKEKIIRGGAFDSPSVLGRCAARASAAPTLRSNRIGFRCASDSPRQ